MNELEDRIATLQKEEKLKYLDVGVEEIEEKGVSVKMAIASEETIDRQGEIIAVDGWDLKNFKRNPVMLWSHNPYEPNVGRGKNMRITEVNGKRKLVFEPEFHGLTPLSATLKTLYEEGYLRAFSVGFLPLEAEGNKYTKQELLEISAVNVPAHPNALNEAYAKGMTEEQIKTVFTEIKQVKEEEKVEEKKIDAPTYEEHQTLLNRIDELEKKLDTIQALPSEGRTEKSELGLSPDSRRIVKAIDRLTEKLLRKV